MTSGDKMPVRRTLSLKGKLPIPRLLWNKNSASFRAEDPAPSTPATTTTTTTTVVTGAGKHHHHHRSSTTSSSHCKKARYNRTNNNGGENSVVFLQRDQVQLGPILGEGGFSQVFGVFALNGPPLSTATASATASATGNDAGACYCSSCRHQGQGEWVDEGNPQVATCNNNNSSSNSNNNNNTTTTNDPQKYSVKVVRKALLSAENKAAFQKAANDLVNEAELLYRLNHPHIIKLRALSQDSEHPIHHAKRYTDFFLLLDRLQETLNHRIQVWNATAAIQASKYNNNNGNGKGKDQQKTNFPGATAAQHANVKQFMHIKLMYAYQLAQALDYIHDKRILFRDIKPENIGFKGGPNDHHLILFDFGMARELSLSKAISSNSNSNSSVGTSTTTTNNTTNNNNATATATTTATNQLPPAGRKPSKSKPILTSQSSYLSSSSSGSDSSPTSTPATTASATAPVVVVDEDDLYWNLTICGTQRYMSHEVLFDGKYNLKSDVYSYAMTVWEIVAQVKPFHYMSPTVHKILVCQQGDRPPLSCYGLPPNVQALLKACWAHKVSDRITMRQVCQRLEAHLEISKPATTTTTMTTTLSLPPPVPTATSGAVTTSEATTTGATTTPATSPSTTKATPPPQAEASTSTRASRHRRAVSYSPTQFVLSFTQTNDDIDIIAVRNDDDTISTSSTIKRNLDRPMARIPRHRRTSSHGSIPAVTVDYHKDTNNKLDVGGIRGITTANTTTMTMTMTATTTATANNNKNDDHNNNNNNDDNNSHQTDSRRKSHSDAASRPTLASRSFDESRDNENNGDVIVDNICILGKAPKQTPSFGSLRSVTAVTRGVTNSPPRSSIGSTVRHRMSVPMLPSLLSGNSNHDSAGSSRAESPSKSAASTTESSVPRKSDRPGLPFMSMHHRKSGNKDVISSPRRSSDSSVPLKRQGSVRTFLSKRDHSQSPVQPSGSMLSRRERSQSPVLRSGTFFPKKDHNQSPGRTSGSMFARKSSGPMLPLLSNHMRTGGSSCSDLNFTEAGSKHSTDAASPFKAAKNLPRRIVSHGAILNNLSENVLNNSLHLETAKGTKGKTHSKTSGTRAAHVESTSTAPHAAQGVGHRRTSSGGSLHLPPHHAANSDYNGNCSSSSSSISGKNASPPKATTTASAGVSGHRRIRNGDSLIRPIQPPVQAAVGATLKGSSGHNRTGSNGFVRSINSIARELVQLAETKPQEPSQLALVATRSASWDLQGPNSGKSNSVKGPSLSELQELKKDLKNQLKQFDIDFARTHGRMPNKAEKEVIRPLYNHYNALKDYIGPVESLKKQLKQYDMHFAHTHGRMPTKAEKLVVRHLYDQYKSLKAEIAAYLMDYERQRQQQPIKTVIPMTLYSDHRVGYNLNMRSFNNLHSFDSDLTPDDTEVGEL